MKDRKQMQIGALALFAGCGTEDLRWLARTCDEVTLEAGTVLWWEGARSHEFVVIVDGFASATSEEMNGEVLLVPGSYYGEVALMAEGPHDRTVRTTCRTTILAFDVRAFRSMLERMPSVRRKLLRDLAVRLREADQTDLSLRAVS